MNQSTVMLITSCLYMSLIGKVNSCGLLITPYLRCDTVHGKPLFELADDIDPPYIDHDYS